MARSLVQDMRYAARSLGRSPGLVAVVLVTLAVGTGATTAIFSVVRGVLLRPLGYHEPDRLVRIFDRWTQFPKGSISAPETVDFRAQSESLESLAVYSSQSGTLTGDGDPTRISIGQATSGFFPLLGVAPALGRGFTAEEEQAGHERVVLLGEKLWRSRYNADRKIVGAKLRIDDASYVVVGVLPAGFSYPGNDDVWVPLSLRPERFAEDQRGSHYLRVLGRLKPGVTVAQAQADFDRIGERLRALHPGDYPGDSGYNPLVVGLLDHLVGDVRPSLWLLVGAAALVLLIACANVANLLLARGATRAREMSLRAALGARRARLVRQLLTESLAIALVGGFAGFLVAMWGVDLLVALAPSGLPRAGEIEIDASVLGFSIGVTALTGVVFGLLPALQTSRVDLHDALRAGTRISAGVRPRRLRRALVVAEVALALVLVTGAGLVTKSFARVLSVDPGFPVDGLLTLRVSLPTSNGPPSDADRARSVRYFTDAVERLAALPGVRAAGAIDVLPFDAYGSDNSFEIEGALTPPGRQSPDEEVRTVLPGTFEALGVPTIRGRTIGRADGPDAPPVLVVNQAFAKKYFRDADPIGKRITLSIVRLKWTTIVGVVGDVRAYGLDAEVRPEMYFPLAQSARSNSEAFLIRSRLPEAELVRSVRAALVALDPDQAIYEVRPMRELVGQSLERRRFVLVLFEIFGALALSLATVGLYGVMAHSVAQRTHEIGVRMALGARRGDVVRMVVREGAFLTGAGLVVGGAAALVATRLVASLLFQVSPDDPVAWTAAVVTLTLAAALATFVPARRASRVDPMQALRDE